MAGRPATKTSTKKRATKRVAKKSTTPKAAKKSTARKPAPRKATPKKPAKKSVARKSAGRKPAAKKAAKAPQKAQSKRVPEAEVLLDIPLPSLAKATALIRMFGRIKIPLIGFCRPKVVSLDQDQIVMSLPLNRRTKNHHGSMYFGALAIGADTAAGLAAMITMDHERKVNGHDVSFVFKDVRGEFTRRPDADVYFTSTQNRAVRALVHKAIKSGKREEMPVSVVCTVPTLSGDEPVANFVLTLSLKLRAKS